MVFNAIIAPILSVRIKITEQEYVLELSTNINALDARQTASLDSIAVGAVALVLGRVLHVQMPNQTTHHTLVREVLTPIAAAGHATQTTTRVGIAATAAAIKHAVQANIDLEAAVILLATVSNAMTARPIV